MRDVLTDLMAVAVRRGAYADARYVRTVTDRIGLRTGRVDQLERSDDEGIGVRVRVGGGWGFAASRGASRAAAEEALRRAFEVAEAQPVAPARPLAVEPPARGSYATQLERDPLSVPAEATLEVLAEADARMRTEARIAVTRARYLAVHERSAFASTEGASLEQEVTACGGGISAMAVGDGESHVRSYPAGERGSVIQGGYEHFAGLDLAAHAPRVADEAVALLSAPRCPRGRATVILSGDQTAMQLHESVGHAVELDRVLGTEASYAGTSFVAPGDLGALRYGSPLMHVTADATVPGGLGTFGWDDEGVAARRTAIVEEGVLRGFLSSRESAAAVGLGRSAGCMRAEGFARQPVVRMTNVNLEPGDAGSLEDLVADTDRGLLMETNRSWSIDQRRLHFQFATEAAWEIVDGRRTRLLRNPSYAGVTPQFWAGLDAVCSASEWQLWGVLNCGKGEPGQLMRVSHGTAPARFRDVEVGIA